MRSPANRRTRSSSAERKKRDSPGSPWRPARPRSWLSMRRDSWRSVPMMYRPPASMTFSRSSSTSRLDGCGRTCREALVVVRVAGLEAELGQLERVRCSALPPSLMSTPRPAMLVAIVTAPGWPASATISPSRSACSGLALSTVCGMPRLLERWREQLGDLDRDRADEHGLAGRVALGDLALDGRPLAVLGLVDLVVLVRADHRPVGRDLRRPAACRSS